MNMGFLSRSKSFTLLLSMALLTIAVTKAFHVSKGCSNTAFHRSVLATSSRSYCRLFSTTDAAADASKSSPSAPSKPTTVPMTLLAGFLGTGKTSTLKHLLENKENLKIGVIVNDVAAVNIDAKLINAQTTGMVELQNGCACCSLSDELFSSVESLVKGRDLDSIVVELSGVADPAAIQSNWNMAPAAVRKQADIARIVTLVDACTFGTDYLSWDMVGERSGWVDPGDECTANRKIAELLAEQVEAANLILVNKVDIATDMETLTASTVARALNKKAEIVQVSFGVISPLQILGKMETAKVEENAHSHGHNDHAEEEAACADVDCADPSHSHSHNHEHAEAACEDTACTDPSHSHSHSQDHAAEGDACEDPGCTDTSYSHSHSHSTSTDELGITSFVFKSAVPFNSRRLMKLLNKWPIPRKDTLDIKLLQEAAEDGYDVDGVRLKDSPFVGVIRSKGFCWFSPVKWNGANEDAWRHDTANYWSHAGKQFSISSAGKWWASISKQQMKQMLSENSNEYERILRDDFVSDEFGDRRQEIVFIGTNIDEDKITAQLSDCLLTPKEQDTYRQKLGNYMATILTTPTNGLFDVGAIDHTDL
jgi:G3E family GTPase